MLLIYDVAFISQQIFSKATKLIDSFYRIFFKILKMLKLSITLYMIPCLLVFLKRVGLELFTLFLEKVCNENFLFSRGKAIVHEFIRLLVLRRG